MCPHVLQPVGIKVDRNGDALVGRVPRREVQPRPQSLALPSSVRACRCGCYRAVSLYAFCMLFVVCVRGCSLFVFVVVGRHAVSARRVAARSEAKGAGRGGAARPEDQRTASLKEQQRARLRSSTQGRRSWAVCVCVCLCVSVSVCVWFCPVERCGANRRGRA